MPVRKGLGEEQGDAVFTLSTERGDDVAGLDTAGQSGAGDTQLGGFVLGCDEACVVHDQSIAQVDGVAQAHFA